MALKHGSTSLSYAYHSSSFRLSRVKHGSTVVLGPQYVQRTISVSATTGTVGMSGPNGQTIYTGTGSVAVYDCVTSTSGTYAATISAGVGTYSASITSRSSSSISFRLEGTSKSTRVLGTITYYSYANS